MTTTSAEAGGSIWLEGESLRASFFLQRGNSSSYTLTSHASASCVQVGRPPALRLGRAGIRQPLEDSRAERDQGSRPTGSHP